MSKYQRINNTLIRSHLAHHLCNFILDFILLHSSLAQIISLLALSANIKILETVT